MMKVFIGADHRGFQLKGQIIDLLKSWGYDSIDVGSYQEDEVCDYPLISEKVAKKVVRSKGSRGILVCMTGIGHSIAANKVPGAYAALCYTKEAAALSREHNNANILVLGAKFIDPPLIAGIIQVWLNTSFEGGRHERRVRQIKAIEKRACLSQKEKNHLRTVKK